MDCADGERRDAPPQPNMSQVSQVPHGAVQPVRISFAVHGAISISSLIIIISSSSSCSSSSSGACYRVTAVVCNCPGAQLTVPILTTAQRTRPAQLSTRIYHQSSTRTFYGAPVCPAAVYHDFTTRLTDATGVAVIHVAAARPQFI